MTTVTERGRDTDVEEAARLRTAVSDRAMPDHVDDIPSPADEPEPSHQVAPPSPDPAASAPPQAAKPKSKRGRLLFLIPILLLALGGALFFGYRSWYEATYFVATDNASITGDLVQVGSLNAGRIVTTRVDVGRPVQNGQEIAVVAMPREIGSSAQGAAPRMGLTGTDDSLVSVYAPLNGIVAARMGQVGGTVSAGQPIYSLIDPAQVWIRANIEEANAWRIQAGQTAEIHVDALNRDFW